MPSYKHPGVYVDEVLNPTFNFTPPSISASAFVGVVNRGPTVATLVTAWSQFTTMYGNFERITDVLPFSVYQFFNNGGQRAWIVREMGSGGVAASRTLKDQAATPQNTLVVTAQNPGLWGNSVYVDIVTTDAVNGRFNLIVRYQGTSDINIVERWRDLSMNASDYRYAPTIVNSAILGSAFVVLTDSLSATVSPNNAPSAITAAQLSGGADPSAPTPTQVSNAINLLNVVQEGFNLNLPGENTATNISAAIAYSDPALGGRGDVFVVVDPPQGQSSAQLVTYAQQFSASSYAAVYGPWLNAGDPSSPSPQNLRLLPPGGFVCGRMAQTDASRGVWKAPAGINDGKLNGVAGLETRFTDADYDVLNPNNVNGMKVVPNVGTCVFGTRTLKTSRDDRYIPVRRTLIFLRKSLLDLTRYAVFEPNNPDLWTSLTNTCDQFLRTFWSQGGLQGSKPEAAYYILCDSSINTPAVVESGEVLLQTGVAVQIPAEFVVITLGLWSGGQQTINIQ